MSETAEVTQKAVNTVDLLVFYAMEVQPTPCEMLPCADPANLPKGLGALAGHSMELRLIGIIDEWAKMKAANQEAAEYQWKPKTFQHEKETETAQTEKG